MSSKMHGLLEDKFDLTPIGLQFCLDREKFLEPEFHVDTFVLEHKKKVSLETLRDDLIQYFNILKSSLIELINEDYADFVHLSTHLVGLDKALEKLRIPLEALKIEVDNVSLNIANDIKQIEQKLDEKSILVQQQNKLLNLRDFVVSIRRLEQLLDSVPNNSSHPTVDWPRLASEFCRIIYIRRKCDAHSMLPPLDQRLEAMCSHLQQSLTSLLVESIEKRDRKLVCQILRALVLMNRHQEAERLIGSAILQPPLQQILHPQRLHTDGLQSVLDAVTAFLQDHFTIVNSLLLSKKANKGDPLHNIDITLHSFWPQFVNLMTNHLSEIFTPADPNTFHHNYSIYERFMLTVFEPQYCVSAKRIAALHASPSYATLQQKWSLPVYFQLRFQEISALVEEAMDALPLKEAPSTPASLHPGHTCCRLQVSAQCMEAAESLWSASIYMTPLRHRFWKLTLQIVNRYSLWIGQMATRLSTEKAGTMTDCLLLLHDVHCVCVWMGDDLLTKHVAPHISGSSDQVRSVLQAMADALLDAGTFIVDASSPIRLHVTQSLLNQCQAFARGPHDVPRQYRKTNRDWPTRASNYVDQMLSPLFAFVKQVKQERWAVPKYDNATAPLPTVVAMTSLPGAGQVEVPLVLVSYRNWLAHQPASLACILHEVLTTLAASYRSNLTELLSSVRKMEESLSKLRRARGVTSNVSAASVTDDDKIHQQLYLDTQHFRAQVNALLAAEPDVPSTIEELDDLVALTETSRSSALTG